MAESARIALLGRAGEAREQLGQALAALGAEIVIAGDPKDLAPDTVQALRPSVVVVSLDSAMEEQLDRWGILIDDPAINVVYDEAEVTRRLVGWDLARWARHLASKILPRSSLLPPAPADALPLAVRPADDAAAVERALSDAPVDLPAQLGECAPAAGPGEFDLDADALAGAFADTGTGNQESPLVSAEDDLELGDFSFDPDLAALDQALAANGGRKPGDSGSDEPPLLDDELASLLAHFDTPGPADRDAGPATDDVEDFDLGPSDVDVPAEPSLASSDVASAQTSPPDAPAADDQDAVDQTRDVPTSSPFANLELLPMDDTAGAVNTSAARGDAPISKAAPDDLALSLDDLVAGLGLADQATEAAEASASGAIVLIAGLGGPDAVRQCLAALPERVPVPVLVWQHLEAANHDRLVPQMARASHVPVYLAAAGEPARSGQAAIVPVAVGIDYSTPEAPRFCAEGASPAEALRELCALGRDVVVVVLSGADPAIVDPAREIVAGGGLVLAQDPATCFDGKAAASLHQAGVGIAAPAELALRAMRHWSV